MDNAGKKPVWSVQPPKGMLKGDYYRIEERFPPYYPGSPGHCGGGEGRRQADLCGAQ